MPQSLPDFFEILKALNSEQAKYVVVGGFAIVLHGGSHLTFALDLAASADETNANALVEALRRFHPYPPNYHPATHFVWDRRSIFGAVVELASDAGLMDILLVQPGIESFDGMYERALILEIAGIPVRVASLDDLIAMKQAANRPKDQAHIAQLKALKALRKETEES